MCTATTPRSGTMSLVDESRRTSLGQSKVLVSAIKLLRELLPGDSSYGDPLSTASGTHAGLIGRRLSQVTAERPGVLREAGLSALQVWEVISQSRESADGERELTVAFTDLAGFSSWALEAGDAPAVQLLREVSAVTEPAVTEHGGEVVKRLGDGMMAVFAEPGAGLGAVLEARDAVSALEAEGYQPQLRAGVHTGCAQRVGDDYFGVDVNVAARVAEEAGAGEVLISDATLDGLDGEKPTTKRKRFFRGKGVPSEVTLYSMKGP
jgi:adenylate cyclase